MFLVDTTHTYVSLIQVQVDLKFSEFLNFLILTHFILYVISSTLYNSHFNMSGRYLL